jgi:hypothetical protein
MNQIKTWRERLKPGIRSTVDPTINELMQAEIDELRAALVERDAEIERLTAMPFASEAVRAFVYGKKIDAQRKVLAQALEALQELNQSDGKDRTAGQLSEAVLQAEAAITAIQEVLL